MKQDDIHDDGCRRLRTPLLGPASHEDEQVAAGSAGPPVLDPVPGPGGPWVTPPMFAIPFGLVGLSGCWRALGAGWTSWTADALAATSAVILALLTGRWCWQLIRRESTPWSELCDPIRGPSVPVVAITAMLLTATVDSVTGGYGRLLVACFAGLTVAGGVAVVTAWLATGLRLHSYHPGFYLPTAGGALLTSQSVARLGWGAIAEVLFYVGLSSWLILGVVTTLRLARTPLAPPLRPVMVIELAAPALAGNTYLVVFGRFDGFQLALALASVLMAALQVVLIPYYRRAQFGPASWSAAFSYATAAALALRWIDHGQPDGGQWWRTLTVTLATAVVVQLSFATAIAVRRRRFFPMSLPRP